MQVRFTHLFVKQISKVQDKRLAKRIEDAITEVKNANILSDITHFKKLKGYTNAYRKSIGDHRIGLFIHQQQHCRVCLLYEQKRDIQVFSVISNPDISKISSSTLPSG